MVIELTDIDLRLQAIELKIQRLLHLALLINGQLPPKEEEGEKAEEKP